MKYRNKMEAKLRQNEIQKQDGKQNSMERNLTQNEIQKQDGTLWKKN